MQNSPADLKELARAHFRALASGDAALTRQIVAPQHINHMAADEPPSCGMPGPAGFLATSAWLRYAFAELRWEDLSYVAEQDWVVAHVRMHGVHHGPFVVYPPGRAPEAFPPTKRRVAVSQAHFFRVRDGQSLEHVAVRDDLGMMIQLGFLPPGPSAGLRLALFQLTGGRRRAVAEATRRAAAAAQLR